MSTLTPEGKDALRRRVRDLREVLIREIGEVASGTYQLALEPQKAKLDASRRAKRARLDAWLDERVRGSQGKAKGASLRDRFLAEAVEEAAHTFLNRIVLIRILEHHRLLAPNAPPIVTGGDKSAGYASEFLSYAGPLADDDTRGFRHLLSVVFDELALELPGLFGKVGVTPLLPVPASALRATLDLVNDPALASAWGDDTTLGWVYQYWNDPEREALDAKIAGGGKIEPHEIASKTQMFTERYMVEWLLQNSLGFTWLAICEKNGWTPDAARVLPELETRRAAWRDNREAGEVALDALMPIGAGLENDWKYWVPQPIPKDAVEKAPASIRDVKLLDPACGSGHFVVIAFGLFARMWEEEARHRGETWAPEEIAARIVAENLHGIDIDARAIQIAAAALWVRAKLYAAGAAAAAGATKPLRLSRMNLVAPRFGLATLPKDDPARAALEQELFALGVPKETTTALVESLKGVDHLGTLLRVDRDLGALLAEADVREPLFVHGAKQQQVRLEDAVARFLDAHASERDLGLRLDGEALAAGVRFIELAREGRYDVVVGNPPYQSLGKTASFEYVAKNYPRGKADLYAAFLERGLELMRDGGISALVTMRGWMFLEQFKELRWTLIHESELRLLVDLDSGAFDEVSAAQVVLSVACAVFRRAPPSDHRAQAQRPTPQNDRASSGMTARKRAALLAQVARYDFDPKSFAVIEGEPVVYWWPGDRLRRFERNAPCGRTLRFLAGLKTGNDTRFIRVAWEVRPLGIAAIGDGVFTRPAGHAPWSYYIMGAAGEAWFEPARRVVRWWNDALEMKVFGAYVAPGTVRLREFDDYFRGGVAFSMIGSTFVSRAHRFPSVFGSKGSSIVGATDSEVVWELNKSDSVEMVQDLNPTISFTLGDVAKLPLTISGRVPNGWHTVGSAFSQHESHREPSVEFKSPGASPWRYAQAWAQTAVDRPEGAPLPPYTPELDPPDPEARVSFAIGVALGRFGANGEGILEAAPKTALPAGILFVGPGEPYADSLAHPAAAAILAAYEAFAPASAKKPSLRDWLRKDFFAYHKAVYENRPIYFPLSSDKRAFVAWVSIHRFTDGTLATLLADHLFPAQNLLDAEIRDLSGPKTGADKKALAAADKRLETVRRLRAELADFITAVTRIAEKGAPPADPSCPPREVDAPFSMDLDDGVMINSAALWPLLAPQWSDPKKWWKQLAAAEGKKDYDWSHLAKRYFPTRVDAKCRQDPSLAVAHGCFWRYHPAKALAWELRLQEEIRTNFTIDEPDSEEARATFLRDHAPEANAAHEKERIRRARKAAKHEEADDDPSNDEEETP